MKTPGANTLSSWSAMVLVTLSLTTTAGSIDATKSQVSATFRQMNAPVEGIFKRFSGTIDFDSKTPATGRARIEIDTASFDVGAPEYNHELRLKEWLDTTAFPKAVFIAHSVAPAGPNRFEAKGKLTLKGRTLAINVPFALRTDGNVRIYEGELPISRKSFSIGSADWDDTLADNVIVKFKLTTTAK